MRHGRSHDARKINLVPMLAPALAQDAFCANTYCWITTVYYQSGKGNHLVQAPVGNSSAEEMRPGEHNPRGGPASKLAGRRGTTAELAIWLLSIINKILLYIDKLLLTFIQIWPYAVANGGTS
jgi:hypothetical protein